MLTHRNEKPRIRAHVKVQHQKLDVGKDQDPQRGHFAVDVQDVERDLRP